MWAGLVTGLFMLATGCLGSDSGGSGGPDALVVNSLADLADPPEGTVTLRSAVRDIGSGGVITFDPALDGGIIDLELVGEERSILKGEVFTFTGRGFDFEGYHARDYGKSALYAAKNLSIDASDLPAGITITWDGDEPARVMAVYGDLTLDNVTISSGISSAVAITTDDLPFLQPFTLARGAGVAVWGIATISDSTFANNAAYGDTAGGRDRGAFGGAIYANFVHMDNCVVSGNRVIGYGASGGGIYSLGGAEKTSGGSFIRRSVISGNRVTGQHAYGGGVYSDGGGPGNDRTIELTGCTLAGNAVDDHPDIDQDSRSQYYYRGGGFYMSNGSLQLKGTTITANEVTGHAFSFSGKPNMGGGGLAATIGNAHVVERMEIQHSIIAGNTVGGAPGDLFSGSLINFYSWGYNLIGDLNFDHILVPVPPWLSLSRKHYPKAGDADGVAASDILDLDNPVRHPSIISVGADSGENAVLYYIPAGSAVDLIPAGRYDVPYVKAQYMVRLFREDDFLVHALDQVESVYGAELGADFGDQFGDVSGITFYGPANTWPKNDLNEPWITFWRDVDSAIGDSLPAEKLADDFWGSFESGFLGRNIIMEIYNLTQPNIRMTDPDQLGNTRPAGGMGDVGAVELMD
jgi:hypothetical protein